MTRRIYEFLCPDGHTNDEFVDEAVRQTECETCGKESTRIVSAVTSTLDPLSGDYPSSTMKWAQHRQHQIQKERKQDPEYNP